MWKAILHGWVRLWSEPHAASISGLTPRNIGEARNTSIALVLQAVVFAIAHAYQGVQACLAIAVYGVMMTFLTLWRRNLRAAIVVHAWTDIAGVLLR